MNSLSSKFEQLVSLYEKACVNLEKLQQDYRALTERKLELEAQLTKLEEKNKSLLITHAFTANDGSAEEATEKISRIVREIDKCITLLTK
ncbi:MAG: hypothetical protein LBH84_02085 [Prevotellaceae bacterium]|nr:hypothetical protein [Prevotellaceae bacterium]